MLEIEAVNHVGIRVREKSRSIAFYESLGFELVADAGFVEGHPVIMRHPSGVVLNLLGPATSTGDSNVLMDIEEKHRTLDVKRLSPVAANDGPIRMFHPGPIGDQRVVGRRRIAHPDP